MYNKLFKVLQENYNLPATHKMMVDMGLKLILESDNSYWSDSFSSCYFSINVCDKTILEVVEEIIESDISSFSDDIAEMNAGEDW